MSRLHFECARAAGGQTVRLALVAALAIGGIAPALRGGAMSIAGCARERDRADTAAIAPESARPPPTSIGPLASAAAFDLVRADEGALIVWSPPAERGGGIWLRRLDAFGRASRKARQLVPGASGSAVSELAAAATGDRLGVIWVETSAGHARTRALLASPDGTAASEPQLLATTEAVPGRGRIAIAALADRRMRVMYAAGPAECAGSESSECTGFAFDELAGGPRARREPWLSVPAACPEGAANLAGLDGRFFYAVCSYRGEAPVTTAYAINVETYYARADEVLRGCAPLGMVAIDASTVLLGADCGVLRRAARLTLDLKPAAEFPLADLAVACRGDRPAIRAAGWELPLDEARAELEAVLPEQLAPAGARALWTGRALLVAERMSGGLELHRHSCTDGALHTATSAAKPGGKR